jgi:hypothetical protein
MGRHGTRPVTHGTSRQRASQWTALGRRWLATDVDKGAVALARKTLAETDGKRLRKRRAG